MVYQNGFVAAIKHNGRIMREHDGIVHLPFGSEFSILLKNLSNRKASVSVSIDGEDVLNGTSILIDQNTSCPLTGFLQGNKVTNNFKFIQKTKEISDYRGDNIDDGIIRIEYKFELQYTTIAYGSYSIRDIRFGSGFGDVYGYSNKTNGKVPVASYSTCSTRLYNDNKEGITVPGSIGNQSFVTTSSPIMEEESNVIVLKLKGTSGKKKIRKPITTKTKVKCPTCGRKCSSAARYCSRCGTGLLKG